MDSHLSEGIEPHGKCVTECIQCSKTLLLWSQTHLPEQGEHQYSCFLEFGPAQTQYHQLPHFSVLPVALF